MENNDKIDLSKCPSTKVKETVARMLDLCPNYENDFWKCYDEVKQNNNDFIQLQSVKITQQL